MGIAGELAVGITLLYCMIRWNSLGTQYRTWAISAASVAVVIMMVTGIYVHLQPGVPAEVLPMNIKPPYIPGLFMALGMLNAWKNLSLIKQGTKNQIINTES